MSSIKMVKTKESMNLNKCVCEIKKDIVVLGTSVELSDEFFTSCNSWFATYEKYYYRTNSTIALSILLEEVDDRFEVYLIVQQAEEVYLIFHMDPKQIYSIKL